MGLFSRKETDSSGSAISSTDEGTKENFPYTQMLIYPYFKRYFHSPSKTANPSLPVISADLISHQLADGLMYFYVVDFGDGYMMIQRSFLEEKGISEKALHEYAMDNLRRLLDEKIEVKGGQDGLMITLNGDLEASLLLVDEIWDQLEEQVGEPIAVAVPSRDVVYGIRKSNREAIGELSNGVDKVYDSSQAPISKHWYHRPTGKWEVFISRH